MQGAWSEGIISRDTFNTLNFIDFCSVFMYVIIESEKKMGPFSFFPFIVIIIINIVVFVRLSILISSINSLLISNFK